ncbi:MAG: ShlB/FhaC/HecB family hemolysin secretion/activation protein [Pseudomonadota bacterium]|nr:ShlB/FhaC/HecB family hemolysin secretion/activation protein [Pseudomonadota bacterium]
MARCLVPFLASLPSAAWAAVGIPPAADAGRMAHDLEVPAAPKAEPGAIPAPSTAEVPAPPGADQMHFVLSRIVLEGAHRYPEHELLAPYQSLIGTEIPLSKIYDAASDIARRYREDGYAFVNVEVPPQRIENGIVRIRVVEGFIARVVMEGVDETSILKNTEEQIVAMRPLQVRTLEEILLLLNDLPGLNVKAVVEPDPIDATEGALLLRLTAERKPVSAGVSVDNYSSRYTGRWQITPQVQYNDMFTAYDKTVLAGVSSIPDSLARYFSVQHSIQLDLRTSVTFNAAFSHSEPGYKLAVDGIISNARDFSVTIYHALLRTREKNASINLKLDANNPSSDILDDTPLYRDRIRALRLGGSFDMVDPWQGVDLFTATLSKGLNILDARPTGSFDLSRAQGRSDFTKLEWSASRLSNIGGGFSLYALTQGQYATSPLLSSEQFGYGGQLIGKAYDPSEITGDRGVSFTTELRYDNVPEIRGAKAQPFLFYDIGKVWNLSRGSNNISAASAGAGFHLQINQRMYGSATIAWPLTRKPQAAQAGNAFAPRIGVSLSYTLE